MTDMTLNYLAEKINARVIGEDIVFSSVSTDTRKITSGDLFVALSGDHFDGHDYLDTAVEKGAAAVMVDRPVNVPVAQLVVDNTRKGYGQMASVWRERVNPRVVALTGSNGKTTLKEMLSAIFSVDATVLATIGNLNNDIGVPATLLRLQNESIAVIEMGANHVGEIDYLSRMAKPDVAVLNNAGRAHIGEFGSEENIARTKAEIINGMSADGVFVYNADSKWVDMWQKLAAQVRSVSFGSNADADYQLLASSVKIKWHDAGFVTCFTIREKHTDTTVEITLPLAGAHNAANAVAAVATARQLQVSFASIRQGLESLQPVKGRLKPLLAPAGQIVIDDSYNANPDSVEAAVNVLADAPYRKILVLGDMAELGERIDQLYAGLGRYAASQGIDVMYTCGTTSKVAGDAFAGSGRHFSSQQELADALINETSRGDVVLIKGSRSAKMEKVVEALMSVQEVASC